MKEYVLNIYYVLLTNYMQNLLLIAILMAARNTFMEVGALLLRQLLHVITFYTHCVFTIVEKLVKRENVFLYIENSGDYIH